MKNFIKRFILTYFKNQWKSLSGKFVRLFYSLADF